MYAVVDPEDGFSREDSWVSLINKDLNDSGVIRELDNQISPSSLYENRDKGNSIRMLWDVGP